MKRIMMIFVLGLVGLSLFGQGVNTGAWTVRYYVDSFGERTSTGYVTTRELIKGTFSNSATQDSALGVYLMVNSSLEINLQLYEYAGKNPVKAYSKESYTVQIQDKNGQRSTLKASNYSDRLEFGKEDSRVIHNAFTKGGLVKFVIVEDDTPITRYRFDVANADFYETACSQLPSFELPRDVTVKYEITGTAKTANITIRLPTGVYDILAEALLPWERTITVDMRELPSFEAAITAQNKQDSGSVTATVYVDGKVLKTATNSGAYATVDVSERVEL